MTNKRLDELLEKARARTGTACPAKKVKAQQLALPFWPEEVRSVPNAVLRGALFTVSKERAVLKDLTHIASVDGIEIRAKNDRLNQIDLDLWEMLLHLQRLQPLGNRVEFSAGSMLKALGRTTGGKDHQSLDNALARLIGSVVEIKWTKERKAFAGALVSSFFRDDETGRYVVKFNQEMAILYGQGHTYIDWEQRQALGQNSLAKWLHGFYSTHANPYSYKVETVQKLCGSTVERLSDFRKLLRSALGKLVEIGAIDEWTIDADSDLVTVDKKPTRAQKRYLARSKIR